MLEEELQLSVLCYCYCFLVEFLALAGMMNLLAQLSRHFAVYNLTLLAFLLAKLFMVYPI